MGVATHNIRADTTHLIFPGASGMYSNILSGVNVRVRQIPPSYPPSNVINITTSKTPKPKMGTDAPKHSEQFQDQHPRAFIVTSMASTGGVHVVIRRWHPL